ncbi:TonB-dependent receptor [Granulicella sp. WH15]|uniref:TonB-dependent receptor domain-containing protein n=1 Tax=Granulicella sp. WH15 TaxID=2602070 RepID=UPI0013A53522
MSARWRPANLPTGSLQPAWDLSDSISYTRGRHTFNFGFDWRDVVLDRQSTVNPEGNFTFDGSLSHNQIADLLLGTPLKAQDAQPGPISDVQTGNSVHIHFKAWAPYLQDDWKVTPKLTLNMGVRYDFQTIPYEEQNHMAWFNPANGGGLFMANAAVAQTYGGGLYTADGQRGPGPAVKNVWAPRFGFAFRPFANATTVFRGGYGIFYDTFETNEFVSSTAVFPFAPTQLYTSTAVKGPIYQTDTLFPPLSVGAATPATFINGSLQIAAQHKLNPYVQDYSLGVEQQLDSKTIFTLEYVGNKGTHLNIRTNPNQPTPCNATTNCNPSDTSVANKTARRPYKNLGLVILEDWSGYSNYNALNAKVERRSKNITLSAGYAWSKMMDIKSAAAALTGDAGGAYGFQNGHCPRCDYARSSYDVGQRFVLSALYNLPFGEEQRIGATTPVVVRKIISGWQVNAIGTLQGGFPFSIAGSDVGSINEANSERANEVGNPFPAGFVKNINHWFNPAAFANPAPGFFGTSSRNLLRGPGLANLDMSVMKNVKIRPVDIQLRIESFNVLNHPEFGTPNNSVTSTSLGTITTTNSYVAARQNQAAVRITF